MPDNKMDEQFVNQGWEQMRALLDQEMPEAEKRRRLVPVWWMQAAAGVLLVLATVLFLWRPQTPKISVAIIEKEKGAQNVAAEEDCGENNKDELFVNKTQKKDIGVTQTSVNKGEIATTFKSKIKSVSPLSVRPNPIISQSTNAEIIVESPLPKSYETNISLTEKELKTDNQHISNISRLNLIAIHEVERKITLPAPPPKLELWGDESTEKKSSRAVKIGVELATYTSAYAALDGYAGGAVVDLPIQNQKLNLRAGVNVSAQQRYFDINNASAAEFGKDMSSNSNAVTVNVNPDPNLSMNAQQLSFPITLQYKPRHSWGLEGGLQASYLLNAQNLKGAEAYQTIAGINYGADVINTFIGDLTKRNESFFTNQNQRDIKNDKIDLNQLNRLDVTATAGIVYYPTQNIGVRLQYQRGLIDLLKAEQFKAFGNNIRFSAVYFFGKK